MARIVVVDAPAVLGLARYTELDERYAFAAIVTALSGLSGLVSGGVSGTGGVDDGGGAGDLVWYWALGLAAAGRRDNFP